MASSSSNNKKVLLDSCDGEFFEVDEVVASESLTIKHMIQFIEDIDAKSADSETPLANATGKSAITLRNVTGKTFAKVLEYCKKHVLATKSADPLPSAVNDELKAFNVEFLESLKFDQKLLFDIISAADYLDIKGLLDLTCRFVADKLTGRTPEEIRAEFNIVNDYTADEENQIRSEFPWAFTRSNW